MLAVRYRCDGRGNLGRTTFVNADGPMDFLRFHNAMRERGRHADESSGLRRRDELSTVQAKPGSE
jgi:hypothetical protein